MVLCIYKERPFQFLCELHTVSSLSHRPTQWPSPLWAKPTSKAGLGSQPKPHRTTGSLSQTNLE